MKNTAPVTPFRIDVAEADLADLQRRLATTRYATPAPGDAWEYGTPVGHLRDLVARWQGLDWRAVEERSIRSSRRQKAAVDKETQKTSLQQTESGE